MMPTPGTMGGASGPPKSRPLGAAQGQLHGTAMPQQYLGPQGGSARPSTAPTMPNRAQQPNNFPPVVNRMQGQPPYGGAPGATIPGSGAGSAAAAGMQGRTSGEEAQTNEYWKNHDELGSSSLLILNSYVKKTEAQIAHCSDPATKPAPGACAPTAAPQYGMHNSAIPKQALLAVLPPVAESGVPKQTPVHSHHPPGHAPPPSGSHPASNAGPGAPGHAPPPSGAHPASNAGPGGPAGAPPSTKTSPGMKYLQQWCNGADDQDLPPVPLELLPPLGEDPLLATVTFRHTSVCHLHSTDAEGASVSSPVDAGASMASSMTREVKTKLLADDASSREKLKRRREVLEGHCMDLQGELSPSLELSVLQDNEASLEQQVLVVECFAPGRSTPPDYPVSSKTDQGGAWKRLRVHVPIGYKIPIDFASAALLNNDDEDNPEESGDGDAEGGGGGGVGSNVDCAFHREPYAVFSSSAAAYTTPLGTTARLGFQSALYHYEQPTDTSVQLKNLACLWRDVVLKLEDEVMAAMATERREDV
eukprot:gene18944-25512_t